MACETSVWGNAVLATVTQCNQRATVGSTAHVSCSAHRQITDAAGLTLFKFKVTDLPQALDVLRSPPPKSPYIIPLKAQWLLYVPLGLPHDKFSCLADIPQCCQLNNSSVRQPSCFQVWLHVAVCKDGQQANITETFEIG